MPQDGSTPKGAREHFGTGKLKIDRSKSVFINCPYDSEFAPIFDSIVFATVCCGFLPRSALESGTEVSVKIVVAASRRLTRFSHNHYDSRDEESSLWDPADYSD